VEGGEGEGRVREGMEGGEEGVRGRGGMEKGLIRASIRFPYFLRIYAHVCLEDKRENYQNCSPVLYTTVVLNYMHTQSF